MNGMLLLFCWSSLTGSGCEPPFSLWPHELTVLHLAGCAGTASPCVTADAGPDFSAYVDQPISLTGSGSIQETVGALSYRWRQVANGAPPVSLSDPHAPEPSFIASVPAEYRFDLTVFGCFAASDQVSVVVTEPDHVPTGLRAQLLAGGLDVVVQILQAPGDAERRYLALQDGRILIHRNGALSPTPFLDLEPDPKEPVLWDCYECGLLGLTFDPGFASNGIFYVTYTGKALPQEDPDHWHEFDHTRLVAFQTANPDLSDPDNRFLVLSVHQPYVNHHGGQMFFAPDDSAYLALGDASPCGDPDNHAQDPSLLLGKMLRFYLNGLDDYDIPLDNPFTGDPNVRDEIWALGFRNPWRWSFDRTTGDLYIADVGQADYEEINFQPAAGLGGGNYGWRIREGFDCFDPPHAGCGPAPNCGVQGLTDPIAALPHDVARCAAIGGFVYRGSLLPQLTGFYVFGDLCSPNLSTLRFENGKWVLRPLTLSVNGNPIAGNLTTIGEGNDGTLYLGTTSTVYQITNLLPEP